MRLLHPLLPALLALPLLAACTSSGDDATPSGPAPLRTPAAGAFDGGPCELVLDDVVDLGRLTEDLRGSTAPEQAEQDRALAAQERLAAVAETAPAAVKPALDQLVTRAGLLRLQADTRMLSDGTLDAVRAAYDAAVDACSGAPAAVSSPTTSPAG